MKKRPEFISIGIVTRAHGIKGELVIHPITDNPEQFETLKTIFVKNKQGERRSFAIERARFRSHRIILKLREINDRNQAQELRGLRIDRRLEDAAELGPDEYYIFDLIGLKVRTAENQWLGQVTDVLTLPANDVYVVTDGEREYLIPAIKDVIKKIDLDEEYILIEAIDGLL